MRVAVCASGRGTNAEALIRYEQEQTGCPYTIALVISSRPNAGVLAVAERYGVASEVQSASAFDELANAEELDEMLKRHGIEFVVLAGYMRKVPVKIIQRYPSRILNIHPALLPKFGGAGMFGSRVFEAILASAETESGVSVHYVNEEYDKGAIVDQRRFVLDEGENLQSLAEKTQRAEHQLYPEVLRRVVESQLNSGQTQKKGNKEEIL